MRIGFQEEGLNKNVNMNIKLRKFRGESSTGIMDHTKRSLRKKQIKS